MPTLFRFELDPVTEIRARYARIPTKLSWYALTAGRFWMDLGSEQLFRYSAEALARLDPRDHPYAEYEVAQLTLDILGTVSAGLAPLPPDLEIVAEDVLGLSARMEATRQKALAMDTDAAIESDEAAWGWVGRRSPDTGYLTAAPRFWFFRVRDAVRVGYDNRQRMLDEAAAWTAQAGAVAMPVDVFASEAAMLRTELLAQMAARLDALDRP